MKSLLPRYAGIVAGIIAITLILGVYAMFGTIDLVFEKDGYEIGRQENISLFDEIELEPGSDYYYEGVKINEDQSVLKNDIPLCLIVNAATFNWDQEANDFVIQVK